MLLCSLISSFQQLEKKKSEKKNGTDSGRGGGSAPHAGDLGTFVVHSAADEVLNACVRACVRARVRECVLVCFRACMHTCVCALMFVNVN